MGEHFKLTDEMKANVGWESPPWTYEVTTTSIRAFAKGVGYTDPVYFDIKAAKQAGYPSLPAPPTYLGTPIYIPGKSDPNSAFAPGSMPDIDFGLPNRLDGGTETEYFEGIFAGDHLTGVTKLVNLETKESKSIGVMLITSIETTFTNQHGKVAAVQRGQLISY